MKINLFKIPLDNVLELQNSFKEKDYTLLCNKQYDKWSMELYFNQKQVSNIGWLENYKNIMDEDDYAQYAETLGSEILSGALLLKTNDCAYVISHGQAHYIIRNYCNREFGLDMAERIANKNGLKMTHSQSFTSDSKKEITSYPIVRELDDLKEFGEVYNYLKCKTVDKKFWGDTAEFGESIRFNIGVNEDSSPEVYCDLIDRIEKILQEPSRIKLPRYCKVTDEATLRDLDYRLEQNILRYITQVDADDYWMNGVSFYFSNDYKYSIQYKRHELTPIRDYIDAAYIVDVIKNNSEIINKDYSQVSIIFYNENGERKFTRKLRECSRVTIEVNNRYYVYLDKGWVEFNESYIEYIKEQIDKIKFVLKEPWGLSEDELIDKCVRDGGYKQLHKQNVYIGKYCIEKADLMDKESVIMVKKYRNTADLVYLIKQATTSLRLSDANELEQNVFKGHNVCLWMLLDRKELSKLSDLKSFHLLDALNDFKHAAANFGLIPVVWVSLEK